MSSKTAQLQLMVIESDEEKVEQIKELFLSLTPQQRLELCGWFGIERHVALEERDIAIGRKRRRLPWR